MLPIWALLASQAFAANLGKVELVEGRVRHVRGETTKELESKTLAEVTLAAGDKIETDPESAALINLGGGIKVMLGRDTAFEIRDIEDGIQFLRLYRGTTRIWATQKSQTPSRPRAIVRTLPGLFGYWDGELLLDTDRLGYAATARVLDGSVEIAANAKDIVKARGKLAVKGQCAEIAGGVFNPPKDCSRKEALEAFAASEPEIGRIYIELDRPRARILAFRLGGAFVASAPTVDRASDRLAIDLEWIPRLPIGKRVELRPFAAAIPRQSGNASALALQGGLLAVFRVPVLAFEAGGGVESLAGVTSPLAQGGLSLRFSNNGFFEGLYFAGVFSLADRPTLALKGGLSVGI